MKFIDFLKKNALLFALVIYASWMTFSSVDNKDLAEHYKLEAERDKAVYKHREDSIRGVLNKEQEERLKLMRSAAAAHMTAQYERNRADKAHKEYEKIKFYAPRNDSERDSLRRAALGK